MPVPAGPGSVIEVSEVKDELRKSSNITVDDDRIQTMIDAAEAAYTRYVGPLSGTVTETVDGGGTSIVLGNPTVSAITSAVYADGTVIDVGDLDLDTRTGIVYWGYNTAGRFSYGARNVTLTYTIGSLPADHRKVIVEEVASWFRMTQRAGGTRAAFPGDGDDYMSAALTASPLTIFPRIMALAAPAIA